MNKTFQVALREFLATVLTKGFLLGIILPPVFMTAAIGLMPLLMNASAPKASGVVAVIDRSALVSPTLSKTLSIESIKSRRSKKFDEATEKASTSGVNLPIDDRTKGIAKSQIEAMAPSLTVEVLPADTDVETAKKPILDAKARNIEESSRSQRVALIVIPPESVTPAAPAPNAKPDEPKFASYQMYVAPKLDFEIQQDITEQVDRAIVDARLRVAQYEPDKIRLLTATPKTETKVVTAEGERKENPVAAMMLPVGFMMLLWISVLVGGQGLLTSTVEEKSSRVMEVLLSAISPMQLMVGKILGQMAVASLILILYATTGVGALIFFSLSHQLDPMLLVYTAIYFVIAFFIMASAMAAIGSAVNDIREAQALMQPIMIVMIIPMVLWLPISRNPNGVFAQVASFIPPISPFVMVVRLAGSEPIPMWQVPVTMLIGIAAMIFMAWAAAKIFRIGVLMFGKPPNFKTLIKWVRMA